ncbi:MAG TPA: histidine phosphatase family protein [Acetobacteraceae bacterium]|nr:histidine phosphatase family protein [Acetobacteraceae bacterium]
MRMPPASGRDNRPAAWQNAPMHQLLLMRHAKADRDDRGVADRDRVLTARGREAAMAMRRAMRELGLAPDLVLVSPSRRTKETLAALEPWDDMPLIDEVDRLYLASATQLAAALREISETVRSILMIGHNPGLHELAIRLASPTMASPPKALARLAEGFPTAALAEYAVAGPWWSLGAGSGQLLRFLAPRDLAEPAA